MKSWCSHLFIISIGFSLISIGFSAISLGLCLDLAWLWLGLFWLSATLRQRCQLSETSSSPTCQSPPPSPDRFPCLQTCGGVCVLVCIAISGHHESHHLLSVCNTSTPHHSLGYRAFSDALGSNVINNLADALFDACISPPPHPLLHL